MIKYERSKVRPLTNLFVWLFLLVGRSRGFTVRHNEAACIRFHCAPHGDGMRSKRAAKWSRQRLSKRRARPAVLSLRSSEGDDEDIDVSLKAPPKILSLAMVALPIASIIFPTLLDLAKSMTPNSPQQLAVVTALFVSNRAYLYLMAATTVGLAATRGARDPMRLGRRIVDLTEELLYRPDLQKSKQDIVADKENKPAMIQNLANSGIEESLDEVSSEAQALVLPLLVSFLLALSAFLIPFWTGSPTTGGSAGNTDIQDLLANIIPTFGQVWNVGLLGLFTRAEVRRLSFEFNLSTSAVLEWGTALVVTALACLLKLWQAQNFVSMALAILVARAIQFDQFAAVVGALTLLTVYDATSVFLIPAAGASEVLVTATATTTDASDSLSNSVHLAAASEAAGSAMGSVAIQKLTSGSFQPGLLITKIGNRLGGSLGLGDAVFPSILACFVKRFDNSKTVDADNRVSLFVVSIGGYLLGCVACEFAPTISSTGLPALLFILPVMLVSVLLAAALGGELQDLISFDPKEKDTE